MGIFSIHDPPLFAFGLLGNIVSLVVFLAPVPTFLRICKKKSTEEFQSFPYVVALFSSMLWVYYASLKSNDAFLLITINAIGCLIETIYIAVYIVHAPKQAKMWTLRILIVLNFGGFCLILLLSHFLAKGSNRVSILGWVCAVFSVIVFIAPLSIMRLVIRTKSVEFMPVGLSFFLTLSAVMWLFYGILSKDFYVAVPNIVGFVFGLLQMVLYVIYKNYKPGAVSVLDPKLPVQMQTSDVFKEKSSTERGDQNVEIFVVDNQDDVKNNMDGSNKNQPTHPDV